MQSLHVAAPSEEYLPVAAQGSQTVLGQLKLSCAEVGAGSEMVASVALAESLRVTVAAARA